MPLAPLAHTPLLFLDDPSMPIDKGPFAIRPFISNHFRSLCGLRAVTNAEDVKNNVGDHSVNHPSHYSSLSDGFLLTDDARASLKPKDRKFFTDAAQQSHGAYLTQALKYALQHRQAVASKVEKSAGKVKGGGRRNPRKDEADTHVPCMSSTAAKKIPGHPLFKGAILAMYNRPDGIMTRIADLMKRTSRSPVHSWRDLVADHPEAPDPYALTVKGSKGALNDIFTQASLELFGPTVLTPSSKLPRTAYKPFVQAVLERSWERESRRLNRTLGTAVDTREKCKSALEGANIDPSWVNLREASQAMKKYKDLVNITGGEIDESIAKLEKSLEDVWAGLGYTRGENGTIRRVKPTKKVVSITEEAMDRAYAAYIELHFPPQQDGVEEITESLASAMGSEEETHVDLLGEEQGFDIGVAEFAHKSLDEMLRLLGLIVTRKIPFSSDELEVQWHQLVAIAVMLKRMFTKKLGEVGQASLLCDEVGLGKTAEVVGTLCILCHLIELQERNLPLIPLLTESGHIYFAGQEKIPSLPSIILLPKSLCIQWMSQFKRFTAPGSFRLIDYAKKGGDRLSYFDKDGGYHEDVVRASYQHRVVFLCTFTSIGAETGDTLTRAPTSAAGRESRLRGDPPVISTNNAPDCTIFAKSFLFFACDELHQLRNATSCQDGATMISCNSVVRVGATASPVFTGSKDAIAGGVILRVAELIGDEGLSTGYELMESQRSRLKEWKSRQPDLVVPASSLASDPQDTQHQQAHQDIAKSLMKNADPKGLKAYFVQKPSIERIRKILAPYIIRRTSKSCTPDGKLILNIPDFVESVVWIALTEVETKALRDLYNRLMSEKPKGLQGEMLLSWNAFLMDYKHVLFHHRMRSELPDKPLEPFWDEWTIENLQQRASSKLLATFDILEHYKDPAAEPLFFNRDGTRDLEKESNFVPPPSPRTPDKRRKILIFIMYERHTHITKIALDLLGYRYVEYNGSKSDVERDRAVKDFETQDDVFVMLLSNVGTTGLNMTMASVLIFLSGLWSGMEIKQTTGRCCRPGQLLVAHIYHLLAPGTADEILSSYATSKTIMENQFFAQKKELANKIFHREDESDSEESDSDDPSSRATRSAVVSRPLKKQEHHEGTSESAPTTNGQTKSRKRKAPTSSKQKSTGSSTGQGAADVGRKRRKVVKQTADDAAALHRTSPTASTSNVSLPAPQPTQMPVSNNGATASSSQPRKRPRMRPLPSDQNHEDVSFIRSPMPALAPVESASEAAGVISVPPNSSVPPPATSAAPPSLSNVLMDPPVVNSSSNTVSDPASTMIVEPTVIPSQSCSVLEVPPRQNTSPSSIQPSSPEHPPSSICVPAPTFEGPSNSGLSSPEAPVEPIPSCYDDSDVDVIGESEGDQLNEDLAGHEPKNKQRSTMPAEPPAKSQDASTMNKAGKAVDYDRDTQVGHFPDEDALVQAFLDNRIDALDRTLIEPSEQLNAQASAVPQIPSSVQPATGMQARTWRTSTAVRSAAKVTGPTTSQKNGGPSSYRICDVVPHDVSQPPPGQPDTQSRGGPSGTNKGGFYEVSEADTPKVLGQNRRAVMERLNHAYQTGAIKIPTSGQTRRVVLSEGIVRPIVPEDAPSHSARNSYRTFHLNLEEHEPQE